MPRPSWSRYTSTPFPAWSIISRARCSCGPQSQRRLPKTSPVRHLEWTRTSTGLVGLPRSLHEGDVLRVVHLVLVGDAAHLAAELGGHAGLGPAAHPRLALHAVVDDVGHAEHV